VDHIFCLNTIARTYLDNSKKLYAFFIDFRAAFNSTDRRTPMYKLSNIGISTKFIQTLQSMYENNEATVWGGVNLSDWFFTESGVKNGCLLSPILFSLFLNEKNPAICQLQCGYKHGGKKTS